MVQQRTDSMTETTENLLDRVERTCKDWVKADMGDECFWEGWPDCPTPNDSLTPNDILGSINTPPQVKPLVWQRNGNHWAGGHGYVVRKFGSEFTLTVRNQFDRNFPTVEAAKEAAQADYTLRIMEALV